MLYEPGESIDIPPEPRTITHKAAEPHHMRIDYLYCKPHIYHCEKRGDPDNILYV